MPPKRRRARQETKSTMERLLETYSKDEIERCISQARSFFEQHRQQIRDRIVRSIFGLKNVRWEEVYQELYYSVVRKLLRGFFDADIPPKYVGRMLTFILLRAVRQYFADLRNGESELLPTFDPVDLQPQQEARILWNQFSDYYANSVNELPPEKRQVWCLYIENLAAIPKTNSKFDRLTEIVNIERRTTSLPDLRKDEVQLLLRQAKLAIKNQLQPIRKLIEEIT